MECVEREWVSTLCGAQAAPNDAMEDAQESEMSGEWVRISGAQHV